MGNTLGFHIEDFAHGGVWMCRPDGEGMQVTGDSLEELRKLLEEFFNKHM